MKAKHRVWMAGLAVLGLALLAVPNCSAQCGLASPRIRSQSSLPAHMGHVPLLPVALAGDDDSDHHGERDRAAIVGMWHVTFTAKTMNGADIPDTVIDNALVVWHGDGTEIMNSGRPPQDGDFCMGVWKQTGEATYELNHFAWGGNQYTPGTPNGVVGDPMGPTRIVEFVRMGADGKHYSGTFTLTAHDTSGHVSTIFTGVISATRITENTTVPDLL